MMDLTSFKLDMDELLGEFVEGNCMSLADMKKKWKDRKFSYIFEAKSTRNAAFFVQALYSHSLSHMISAGPLPERLGALYILYCLHEIQPYKPSFKIYLSLGELRKLRNLVGEARALNIELVPALVKRMLERNMFLFGFVDVLGGTTQWSDDDITRKSNWQIEKLYEKLFEDSNIEKYLHMNLGAEMDIEKFKKNLSDYELTKELAIQEASKTADIKDMEHIVEKKTVADVMESIVNKWNAQKDKFYEKTGISRPDQIVATENSFDKELESILGE